MPVRREAGARYLVAALIEQRERGRTIRRAVELLDVLRDPRAAHVEPSPGADSIPRVDGVLTLRAQVCTPHQRPVTCRLGEVLADAVRAGEPAQVAAIARARACQKE